MLVKINSRIASHEAKNYISEKICFCNYRITFL